MPETTVAVPARLGHRPALDGLRALAVLAVLLRHSAPDLVGGAGVVGVGVFFTLSGFLITSLLLEERDRTGRVSVRGFYVRRIARLWPGLWTALAAFAVVAAVGPVGAGSVTEATEWALGYCYNVARVVDRPLPSELGALWSLSVEEQFYLLWPMVVIWAAGRGRVVLRWTVLTAVVAGMLARVVLLPVLGTNGSYFSTTSWIDLLAVGALVAVARRDLVRTPALVATPLRVQLVAAAAAVCATGLALVPDLRDTNWVYVAGLPALAVAAAVLVAAALRPVGWLRVLAWGPLRWVGRLSYSLYLWNLMVMEVGDRAGLPDRLPGGLAGARLVEWVAIFALASASFYLVERPVGRRVARWAQPRPRGRHRATA